MRTPLRARAYADDLGEDLRDPLEAYAGACVTLLSPAGAAWRGRVRGRGGGRVGMTILSAALLLSSILDPLGNLVFLSVRSSRCRRSGSAWCWSASCRSRWRHQMPFLVVRGKYWLMHLRQSRCPSPAASSCS